MNNFSHTAMNKNMPFVWRAKHRNDKNVPFVWRVNYRNDAASPAKTLEIAHEKARQYLRRAAEIGASWPKPTEFVRCQLVAKFLRLLGCSF